ncbi:MAG: hypothetical protein K0Q55_1796 [Verrucomicrobia bacterium]|jgi:putative salt-induced outer membrane protein YdiY|nr:hypothetical protein [Verrucomicrobiota bacterium]
MSFLAVPIRVTWAFILLVGVTASASAQTNQPPIKTEIIRLKNGDRVTGVVIKEDETSVHLNTKWSSSVILPKVEIEKRELETPVKEPVKALPVATVIDPLPAPPPASAPGTPAAPTKPKGTWKANLQLGADLRESTVSSYMYSASAKVTYARGNWHNSADWRYSYGKSGNTLSADRMDGTLKSDLDLGKDRKWFVYALGGAGYDEVRKIDYQYEFGPGLGRHLLIRTNMALNGEVGLSFQEQNFNNASRRSDLRLRVAEDYFWRITPKVKLEQKAEIQPAFDDFADYRIRFETGISYALFNNVSWNVSVIDIYDSQPAVGVSNNDLQVRSGVGISF